MNRNPREWAFWDNGFFGWSNKRTDPAFDWFMVNITVPVMSMLIFGLLFFASVLEYGLGFDTAVAVMIGAPVGWLVGYSLPRMSRIYKGHSLPGSGRYGSQYNFPERAKEYFSLSKEDRNLYPMNILNIVRDPDLTKTQLASLDDSMSSIYNGIQERDKQRRLLAKRDVDIDGLVEYMSESKRGLTIDADTYRDYR